MSSITAIPLYVDKALLGFLREGGLSGYEFLRLLRDPGGLGQVLKIEQSQLEALLTGLEMDGYMTRQPHSLEPEADQFNYRLTKRGCETFLSWINSPVAHWSDFRAEFLAKLYFAQREGPDQVALLIDLQYAVCRLWLAAQEAQAAAVREVERYEWLVCRFHANQLQAVLT